jgi:hypothetical protein
MRVNLVHAATPAGPREAEELARQIVLSFKG